MSPHLIMSSRSNAINADEDEVEEKRNEIPIVDLLAEAEKDEGEGSSSKKEGKRAESFLGHLNPIVYSFATKMTPHAFFDYINYLKEFYPKLSHILADNESKPAAQKKIPTQKKFTVVEFPGIVKNDEKALKMMGGIESVETVRIFLVS